MANYTRSKIDLLKEMVKRAISNGYRFDCLLADSWFACKGIIKFIKSRRIKCNYLGMIKMGEKDMRFSLVKNGDKLSSKAVIAKRSTKKSGMKYSRQHRCNYIIVDAFNLRLEKHNKFLVFVFEFFCNFARKYLYAVTDR